jgi:hypothetical protein
MTGSRRLLDHLVGARKQHRWHCWGTAAQNKSPVAARKIARHLQSFMIYFWK